jgi:hypothetical protein
MSLNLKEDMHAIEHAHNYNFKEMMTMPCMVFLAISTPNQ